MKKSKRYIASKAFVESCKALNTVCIIWQEKSEIFVCVLVLYIFQSPTGFVAALFMIHWPYQKSEMEPHLCN